MLKIPTGANLNETISNLTEYGDKIIHVDFRLNTAQVKRDMIQKTNAFMKNPKKKRK